MTLAETFKGRNKIIQTLSSNNEIHNIVDYRCLTARLVFEKKKCFSLGYILTLFTFIVFRYTIF